MGEIFLSHSSEDKLLAEELCRELEAEGFSCWIAPRDIDPGVEYPQALRSAISNASILLLMLSTNADQSIPIRRELEIADRAKVEILPVRLEEKKSFDNLDYYVSAVQWCDLIARPFGADLARLKEILRRKLGDPNAERLWKQLGGPLADRYALRRPRALLSLDAAGIRGLITLEVLARIESLLASRSADPHKFRLADFFDFVAGSGTGALFAIALAQGRSVQELLEFFTAYAADIFGDEVQAFGTLFSTDPIPPSSRLNRALQKFIGTDVTLSSEELRCLLMIVVQNCVTNGPWPLTNNPLAKFNDPSRVDSNRLFPLLPLARASLSWSPRAEPEVLRLDSMRQAATLSDGTFTPYANPAFLLYERATAKPYRLEWKRGERNLLLVSVAASDQSILRAARSATPVDALLAPFMVITSVDQDQKCRTIGRCIHGPVIDREVGDLIAREPSGQTVALSRDLGRDFTYVRYQLDLNPYELRALGAHDPRLCDPERVFNLRSRSDLDSLREVGRLAAAAVTKEHFDAVRIPV